MQAQFQKLLQEFTAGVESGSGERLAATFAEDGVYHDAFYGAFKGRTAIAGLLENLFYRDGENFKWDMAEPVSNGEIGYARWFFSYDSKLPHTKGKRMFMDGIGQFHLRDGLFTRYEDFMRSAEMLMQLEMPEAKQQRVVARMFDQQMADPHWQSHRKV